MPKMINILFLIDKVQLLIRVYLELQRFPFVIVSVTYANQTLEDQFLKNSSTEIKDKTIFW